MLDVVEKIIKDNHIFNNVILVLRPRVIKVSPKSDISIIWFDIWDAQSSCRAKSLINRYGQLYCYYSRHKYKSRSLPMQKLLEIGTCDWCM